MIAEGTIDMTMSKTMKVVCIALFLALFATDGKAARNCIMLGWTGGAAESGVKWVRGTVSQSGQVVTISYDWKNGIMTGRVQEDGSLHGTWVQDGSDGGKFRFRIPTSGQAKGWWSSNSDHNKKRGDMIIRNCE